mmetsp:Transcript_1276/g.2488  ORF Transcript_1276/g.2488 Transcript_1276/m.2488 type:complete len:337 (+) Transcript_1276:1503-2513(+)
MTRRRDALGGNTSNIEFRVTLRRCIGGEALIAPVGDGAAEVHTLRTIRGVRHGRRHAAGNRGAPSRERRPTERAIRLADYRVGHGIIRQNVATVAIERRRSAILQLCAGAPRAVDLQGSFNLAWQSARDRRAARGGAEPAVRLAVHCEAVGVLQGASNGVPSVARIRHSVAKSHEAADGGGGQRIGYHRHLGLIALHLLTNGHSGEQSAVQAIHGERLGRRGGGPVSGVACGTSVRNRIGRKDGLQIRGAILPLDQRIGSVAPDAVARGRVRVAAIVVVPAGHVAHAWCVGVVVVPLLAQSAADGPLHTPLVGRAVGARHGLVAPLVHRGLHGSSP